MLPPKNMPPTIIGIAAPGAMGAGVGRRLVDNGALVLTLLEGRSDASRERAHAAGMKSVDLNEFAEADIILSILPPSDALNFAHRLAPFLSKVAQKPVFVDCNALDIQTVEAVFAVINETSTPFLDGGIIGLPPEPGTSGPTFYLSGENALTTASALADLGLQTKPMDAPVGAASALKMSYAGITKGLAAIASVMILGSVRAGAGDALRAELARSQPQLLARFCTSLPGMVPKAYRWVGEMREIATFLKDDPAGAAVFEGIAQFYERIAVDAADNRTEVLVIEHFLKGSDSELT